MLIDLEDKHETAESGSRGPGDQCGAPPAPRAGASAGHCVCPEKQKRVSSTRQGYRVCFVFVTLRKKLKFRSQGKRVGKDVLHKTEVNFLKILLIYF